MGDMYHFLLQLSLSQTILLCSTYKDIRYSAYNTEQHLALLSDQVSGIQLAALGQDERHQMLLCSTFLSHTFTALNT
jgi:hypothetical protein